MNKHGQWVIGVPSGDGASSVITSVLILMAFCAVVALIGYLVWRRVKARRQSASERRARARNDATWRESQRRDAGAEANGGTAPAE